MDRDIKPTKINNMKKVFLSLFLIFSLFTFAKEFKIIAKPGFIVKPKEIIYLRCEDYSYEDCYFNVALEDGVYAYISANHKDTITLFVEDSTLHVLGLQSQKTIRVIE